MIQIQESDLKKKMIKIDGKKFISNEKFSKR